MIKLTFKPKIYNIPKRDKNYICAFVLIKESIIITKTNPKTQRNPRSSEGYFTTSMLEIRGFGG